MGKENEQPLSHHCAGEKEIKDGFYIYFFSRSLSSVIDHIKSAA
jgi:hypothetical protein